MTSPRRAAAAAAAPAAASAPRSVGSAYDSLTGFAALATAAVIALLHLYGASAGLAGYSLGGTASGAPSLRLAAASFLGCTTLLSLLPRGAPLALRVYVVSTVHAVLACYLAARALLQLAGGRPLRVLASEALAGAAAIDGWRADAGWANAATAVIAGYTGADIAFALVLDGSLLDVAMRAHHAIALLAFGSSIAARYATPYMALVVLTEASTPLLNFYHTWARAGLLRMLNGAALWLCYLLFRVVLVSAILLHVARSSTAQVVAEAPPLWYLYVASLLTVHALNVWWWWRITLIFVRALRGLCSAPPPPPAGAAPAKKD